VKLTSLHKPPVIKHFLTEMYEAPTGPIMNPLAWEKVFTGDVFFLCLSEGFISF